MTAIRILHVDDEPDIRELATETIEAAGAEVRLDAQDAAKAFRAHLGSVNQ